MYAYLLSMLFLHKDVLSGFFQNFSFTFNLEKPLRLLYNSDSQPVVRVPLVVRDGQTGGTRVDHIL